MFDTYYVLKMSENWLYYDGRGDWTNLKNAFRYETLKDAQTAQYMHGKENCTILKIEWCG